MLELKGMNKRIAKMMTPLRILLKMFKEDLTSSESNGKRVSG
jgi:hypothetical protein